MIRIDKRAEIMLKEPNFQLFNHAGLVCCVYRISHSGCLNGYVAVGESHIFYGRHYSDKMHLKEAPKFNNDYIGLMLYSMDENKEEGAYPISLAMNVHHGVTYAESQLACIEKDMLGKLWWFGFDTMHLNDIKVFETEIERQLDAKFKSKHHSLAHDPFGIMFRGEYRDFDYVMEQTKALAEQIGKYNQIENSEVSYEKARAKRRE